MSKIIQRIKQKNSKHFSYNGVEVFVKDPLNRELSAKSIIKKTFSLIPKFLLRGLDIIYIGKFEELESRELQALYKDSAIYATNNHKSEESMVDDLIHEIAHSVEERYGRLIYSDLKLEKEFLSKRKSLWSILKAEGYKKELLSFLNVDFDESFDLFLYKEVGYPFLSVLTVNLFFSPYGATSLREYFANGFEAFFMREGTERLKSISPILYEKLVQLLNLEEGDHADV